MNRMLSLALAAALVAVPVLSGPAMAGAISFDLPNLTWPDAPQGGSAPSQGGAVLGTKSAVKG